MPRLEDWSVVAIPGKQPPTGPPRARGWGGISPLRFFHILRFSAKYSPSDFSHFWRVLTPAYSHGVFGKISAPGFFHNFDFRLKRMIVNYCRYSSY